MGDFILGHMEYSCRMDQRLFLRFNQVRTDIQQNVNQSNNIFAGDCYLLSEESYGYSADSTDCNVTLALNNSLNNIKAFFACISC